MISQPAHWSSARRDLAVAKETGDYKHIQAILVNTFSSWEELNTSFKVSLCGCRWLGDPSLGVSSALLRGSRTPGIAT